MTEECRPILNGARVVLRPLTEADIGPLARIVSEPEIAKWWIDYDERRLRKEMLEDPDVEGFAIELNQELIGTIEYHEENDPDYRYAMVDVTVDTAHLGQGLGTDALRTLARYLFEKRGHHRLMIDPAVANTRAIRAYEKVGFKPVGVMRKYEVSGCAAAGLSTTGETGRRQAAGAWSDSPSSPQECRLSPGIRRDTKVRLRRVFLSQSSEGRATTP